MLVALFLLDDDEFVEFYSRFPFDSRDFVALLHELIGESVDLLVVRHGFFSRFSVGEKVRRK